MTILFTCRPYNRCRAMLGKQFPEWISSRSWRNNGTSTGNHCYDRCGGEGANIWSGSGHCLLPVCWSEPFSWLCLPFSPCGLLPFNCSPHRNDSIMSIYLFFFLMPSDISICIKTTAFFLWSNRWIFTQLYSNIFETSASFRTCWRKSFVSSKQVTNDYAWTLRQQRSYLKIWRWGSRYY